MHKSLRLSLIIDRPRFGVLAERCSVHGICLNDICRVHRWGRIGLQGVPHQRGEQQQEAIGPGKQQASGCHHAGAARS